MTDNLKSRGANPIVFAVKSGPLKFAKVACAPTSNAKAQLLCSGFRRVGSGVGEGEGDGFGNCNGNGIGIGFGVGLGNLRPRPPPLPLPIPLLVMGAVGIVVRSARATSLN